MSLKGQQSLILAAWRREYCETRDYLQAQAAIGACSQISIIRDLETDDILDYL